MRLRHRDHAPAACSSRLARGGQHRADLYRVVRIIVDDHRVAAVAGHLAHAGKAPPHPAEAGKAIADHFILAAHRSEEHTSELQSLMRISYAVFCLKKNKK